MALSVLYRERIQNHILWVRRILRLYLLCFADGERRPREMTMVLLCYRVLRVSIRAGFGDPSPFHCSLVPLGVPWCKGPWGGQTSFNVEPLGDSRRVGSFAESVVEVFCMAGCIYWAICFLLDLWSDRELPIWLGQKDFLGCFDAELVPLREVKELPWSHGWCPCSAAYSPHSTWHTGVPLMLTYKELLPGTSDVWL